MTGKRSRFIDGGVGVAVIGAGSIGSLRSEIAHRHPSVDFLAVCDIDGGKLDRLSASCDADVASTDAIELVTRDEVDAVIVASTEDSHYAPAMAAIQAGKHLLIEKPFTILPDEGYKLLAAADEYGVRVYTGFTQRFRRRYLAIKEHIAKGYIGDVTSAKATIYLAESVARAVISRAGSTTPSVNTMTYLFDLLNWYLGGALPATVYAAGSTKGRIHDDYDTPDSTWSVLKYDDGMVANLGVSWELPEFWPAYVATMDFEVFGREGTVSVRDDHRDVLLASRKPIPSPYTPDATMNVAMLGSYMPGDWALGEHFGAMQEETHAFINSVGQNRQDPILATGAEGIDVLKISRAVDRSAASGEIVEFEW
ncbi:MAG: Gfo/Idh/MocA family oxidoreductase [Acidimicrobiia bacterium]|nr:Gfo/Idh/MocA family oxidoreductase [Acidimicrobiia bacterium]